MGFARQLAKLTPLPAAAGRYVWTMVSSTAGAWSSLVSKLPVYQQSGTILNVAVTAGGTISVFNQAGTAYTVPVVAS